MLERAETEREQARLSAQTALNMALAERDEARKEIGNLQQAMKPISQLEAESADIREEARRSTMRQVADEKRFLVATLAQADDDTGDAGAESSEDSGNNASSAAGTEEDELKNALTGQQHLRKKLAAAVFRLQVGTRRRTVTKQPFLGVLAPFSPSLVTTTSPRPYTLFYPSAVWRSSMRNSKSGAMTLLLGASARLVRWAAP